MTKLGCEKDGFKGTYAENELISLMLPLINKGEKQISWIMNTEPDTESGVHWVAFFINEDSVDYFNSLGENPSKYTMENIKQIVAKLDREVYLKFKQNLYVTERYNSSDCGYQSILFLLDRYEGKPFVQCIKGYSSINRSEVRVHKLIKKLKKLQYI